MSREVGRRVEREREATTIDTPTRAREEARSGYSNCFEPHRGMRKKGPVPLRTARATRPVMPPQPEFRRVDESRCFLGLWPFVIAGHAARSQNPQKGHNLGIVGNGTSLYIYSSDFGQSAASWGAAHISIEMCSRSLPIQKCEGCIYDKEIPGVFLWFPTM